MSFFSEQAKRLFLIGDPRFRGLRMCGCLFLLTAAIDLLDDGWRSTDWVGRLLMALGFFGMSAHEESDQARGGPRWRSKPYVAGVSAGLLGLGILFVPLIARHLV
jgi:hypothetical protein